MKATRLHPLLFAMITAVAPTVCVALTVTAPPAGSTTVAAGADFATQVIGDPWDMSNAQDVDTDESTNLTAQTFTGGVYSTTATACAASFWPQYASDGANIVAIKRGPRYPINTATYRYFTIKIKSSTAQQDRMLFFKDGDNAAFGSTYFKSVPANQWWVLTWDLDTETFPPSPTQPWTSFPTVQGIRFDPCNSGTAAIQVDWIRLTAAPSAANMYTVTWTDSTSGTYTVSAIDADNAVYTFTTSASGTSFAADLSRLAPGDYHIQVSRSGGPTALSSGVIHVNAPPQVGVTAPSIRGEQSLSYALTQQGSQWAVPMNNADFQSIANFTNITYSNPSFPGSFSGRPTSGDTQFIMNTTGHPIDANLYRSVCFTYQVFGTRNFADGWVARLFWGVNSSAVTVTKDIIVNTGLTEYCLPDLADSASVPLEPGSPQPWAGNLGYFRLDPDELTPPGGCSTPQACHDVRLDSVILSPFAATNPTYTVRWTITDPDYAGGGSVQILLDPDKTYGNGNEVHVATVAYTTGASQYTFNPSATGGPNGRFNVIVLANDGTNAVPQYAGGPLIVSSDVIFRNGFE